MDYQVKAELPELQPESRDNTTVQEPHVPWPPQCAQYPPPTVTDVKPESLEYEEIDIEDLLIKPGVTEKTIATTTHVLDQCYVRLVPLPIHDLGKVYLQPSVTDFTPKTLDYEEIDIEDLLIKPEVTEKTIATSRHIVLRQCYVKLVPLPIHDLGKEHLQPTVTDFTPKTLEYEEIDIEDLLVKPEVMEKTVSTTSHVVLRQCYVMLVPLSKHVLSQYSFTSCRSEHSIEKSFKCDQCSYTCYYKGNLRRHIFSHSGEKPFQCHQCSYSCRQTEDLKRHNLMHSGEKPFKCDQCSYTCCHKGNLKRHIFTHSGEKPYQCDQCSYTCRQTEHLKRHNLIHFYEKPLKCDQCSYTCCHKGNLKRHMLKHCGEKPFQCDQCSFTCRQIENLRRHKLFHSGEKPFQCDQCSYTCRRSEYLKSHKLIHYGEKPFQCDQCRYTCRRSGHLKRHKLIHSSEKPFQCDQCSYTCRHVANLKKHKFKHSDEKPF